MYTCLLTYFLIHSMWGVDRGWQTCMKATILGFMQEAHGLLLLGTKSQSIEKGKHGYVRWLHKMGHVSWGHGSMSNVLDTQA